MKKSIIVVMFLSLFLTGFDCLFPDDSGDSCSASALDNPSDTNAIGVVIGNLENALNQGDGTVGYNAFMALTHEASEYATTFTLTQFNAFSDNYTFGAFTGNASGDTCNATVTLTATVDGFDEPTRFVMRKEGVSWKVFKWYEGSPEFDMFLNEVAPQ